MCGAGRCCMDLIVVVLLMSCEHVQVLPREGSAVGALSKLYAIDDSHFATLNMEVTQDSCSSTI